MSSGMDEPRLVGAFRRISRGLFLVIGVLGLCVLLAWAFEVEQVKSVASNLAPMKANTATLFILLGVGGIATHSPRRPRIRVVCGTLIVVVAAATAAQYLFGLSFGIDQILFRASGSHPFPGRMSIAAVVCFHFLGAALLLVDAHPRLAQLAVVPVFFVAFLSFCGYTFGAESLYRVGPYAQIAFHTTLAFLASALALCLANPVDGLMRVPSSDTTAGAFFRRLLLAIVIVPIALGWLGLHGQALGHYDSAFEVAIQVAGSVFLLAAVAWLAGASLLRTEERSAAAETESRARRFERDLIFDLSVDPIAVSTGDGYWKDVNPAMERVLGYTRAELLARPFIDFVHPDDRVATLGEMAATQPRPLGDPFENRYVRKDGAVRWLEWHTWPKPAGDHYHSTAHDTTETRRIERELKASLKEKEILLQEVHHRVKNNLQVISSLIAMQGRTLEPGNGQDALMECQSRVQTIALIHEKLYQSRDYADVPFAEYARGLATNVVAAQSSRSVSLEVVTEPIHLSVDKAIPCGLILNELLTNALKHAFPGDRGGTVRVALERAPDERIRLSVSDDGIGLSPATDPENPDTLGLELVTTLVEQLEGRLDIVRSPGASFAVTFPATETA